MATQLELTQRPFIELQIEVLVEENRIKPNKVNKFVTQLKKRLSEIGELNYGKILDRTLRLPLIGRPNSMNEDYPKHFKFIPPEQLDIIGGFRTSTALKRTNYVDLAVCMPAQCFDKKDVKNQRYHQKRALYLAQLAHLLNGSTGIGLIERLEFQYYQGDYLKPVLLVVPKDSKLKLTTTFQLFCYPHPDTAIKLSLLSPSHGNIAPNWFFKDYPFTSLDDELRVFIEGDSDITLSPFYNSSILFDMELISNSDTLFEQIGPHVSIIEALLLTKIWLYQRNLHHHFSFILSMFIAYLQTRQIVHQNMSSYQIFKVIVKSIASSDWNGVGLSFFDDAKDKIPTFKTVFPVVFLSPSGNLNMCYNITIDLYNRLKHEAELAQDLLNSNTAEIFELLFLKKLDFLNKFDIIVQIPKCTKKLPPKLEYLKKFMDYGMLIPRVFSENILNLAHRALTDRVVLMQQSPDHLLMDKKWNLKSIPYDPTNNDNTFTIGLLIQPEKSLRIIDVGPSADTPEAEDFRRFWEPKSQLRLQNGVISETVVWHVKSFSQRRAIIKYILDHALKKADLHHPIVHYTLLERYIKLDKVFFQWRDQDTHSVPENGEAVKRKHKGTTGLPPVGVGEEMFQRVLHGYNELNKVLRSVENMKHIITTIQPMSHHLRSSAVFPPLPVSLQIMNKSLKRRKGVTLFPSDFNQAGKILHLEPIEILLTLDSSGKWPNELDALEAAKLEYLIQLSEGLREKEYSVKFAENYLDVLHGQFVFRLRIKCQKQLTMIGPACGKAELQKKRIVLEILPRVHAALDQLYREKPAFGLTCRLVKRWISCQLMTDHFSDITLDLMVAHLFLHPQPYTEPSGSSCGFRRFLMLVSQHDWAQAPLVINFDDQLKIDEANKVRDAMLEDRSKFPPIVICTPFAKEASPWTKLDPTQPTLELLCRICAKALEFFDNDILNSFDNVSTGSKALFLPNFKMFNLLIKLYPQIVQNFFMSINPPKEFNLSGKEPSGNHVSAFKVMPIVGLNIIEQYVRLLRMEYGNVAMFFYDKYGQRLIGVILKSEFEKSFDGDLAKFTAGIRKLGAKLVESITVVKEKEKKKNNINSNKNGKVEEDKKSLSPIEVVGDDEEDWWSN